FRGFGGTRFVIEMFDGTRFVTTNLWTQGEIPDRFRHLLPDNARFGGKPRPGDTVVRKADRPPIDITEAARSYQFPHRLLVSEDLYWRHVVEPGGGQDEMAWRLLGIIYAAGMAVKCAEGQSEVSWNLARGEEITADITVRITTDDRGETTVTVVLDE